MCSVKEIVDSCTIVLFLPAPLSFFITISSTQKPILQNDYFEQAQSEVAQQEPWHVMRKNKKPPYCTP